IRATFIKSLDKIIIPKYVVFNINSSSIFEISDWNFYRNIYEIIDSIIKEYNLSTNTYIRTFQSFELDNRWLSFGRMKWNLENNKKWTHKYKTKEYSTLNLQFFNTEIWSPDWNHFEKTGDLPIFFSKIYHENGNRGIFIALKLNVYKSSPDLVDKSINNIEELIPDSEVRLFERYWTPSAGFYNNMLDITYEESLNAK
ncbi:MAG: hypothetical protein ABI554_09310, partial [Flavobacterium sp.]